MCAFSVKLNLSERQFDVALPVPFGKSLTSRLHVGFYLHCLYTGLILCMSSSGRLIWYNKLMTAKTVLPGHRSVSDALSPSLTGRMFLREPSWKYSAKLVGS